MRKPVGSAKQWEPKLFLSPLDSLSLLLWQVDGSAVRCIVRVRVVTQDKDILSQRNKLASERKNC